VVLVPTAGVDYRPGLALEFRCPLFRRPVALLVARGAEDFGDPSVTFLGIEQLLKVPSQEVTSLFTDA